MNPKWAEDNLQTIRTLMERSALYRRALAPIMIFVGVVGIAGGAAGWWLQINGNKGFLGLWMGVAVISLAGALLLVRRQALKESEAFWSPPTRRVVQAMMPAFFIGLTLALFAFTGSGSPDEYEIMVIVWTLSYGCAIHAAGFFMPRGVRWLGWIFVITGLATFICMVSLNRLCSPHLLMGAIFGGGHLAYGIYLYFTEKKSPQA